MRVLVTGSNGRVGSVVAARLAGSGHEVVGVDLAYSAAEGITWTQRVGSILEPFFLERLFDEFDGFDAVAHLANRSNVRAGRFHGEVLADNLAMNALLISVCLDRRVRRFVWSSSIQAVYSGQTNDPGEQGFGAFPEVPMNESSTPAPNNGYGVSKLLTERMLDQVARPVFMDPPMIAVSLRLSWVSGGGGLEMRLDPAGFFKSRHVFSPDMCNYVMLECAAEAFERSLHAELSGHEVFFIMAPDMCVPPEAQRHVLERVLRGDADKVDRALAFGNLIDVSKAERLLGWRGRAAYTELRERERASSA